jgi:hypothetical protein
VRAGPSFIVPCTCSTNRCVPPRAEAASALPARRRPAAPPGEAPAGGRRPRLPGRPCCCCCCAAIPRSLPCVGAARRGPFCVGVGAGARDRLNHEPPGGLAGVRGSGPRPSPRPRPPTPSRRPVPPSSDHPPSLLPSSHQARAVWRIAGHACCCPMRVVGRATCSSPASSPLVDLAPVSGSRLRLAPPGV